MELLRLAKGIGIRALAALLIIVAAAVTASIRLAKRLERPDEVIAALRARKFFWPWLTHSYKLVLGTLAYNAFVFVVVEPVLRQWFPPLKPWEHLQGIFGSTRTTYDEILPTVATALWIAGNALVIVLLNRRLQVARDVE